MYLKRRRYLHYIFLQQNQKSKENKPMLNINVNIPRKYNWTSQEQQSTQHQSTHYKANMVEDASSDLPGIYKVIRSSAVGPWNGQNIASSVRHISDEHLNGDDYSKPRAKLWYPKGGADPMEVYVTDVTCKRLRITVVESATEKGFFQSKQNT